MVILLVEDNFSIVRGLEYAFKSNGYEFHACGSVKETKKFLEEQYADLIVLDITLPDGNGLRLYEEYLSRKEIPTIFLTAEDDEEVVVKGLELGADDYITKPFSTKELMARVNRILFRNRKKTYLKAQDVVFDLDKMSVTKAGQEILLTSLELKLLHLLFTNIGKVVSRNTMLDKIWEWTGNDVDDHTITVYLKRIRQKVGDDLISTVKGIGYRIDADEK